MWKICQYYPEGKQVAVARWIALHDPLIVVLQGNQVQSERTAIVEESPGC